MEEKQSFSLQNKTAILTGASGGIGFAVTQAYLKQGANCLACDLNLSKDLQNLKNQFPAQLQTISCDVTKPKSIAESITRAKEQFGYIDILFNNAAIFDLAPFLESDEIMYEKIFDVNVKGMFLTMQAVAKQLVQQNRRGKIINLASQAGRRGESLVSHYCASKAAVISYTQSAALALAPYHINVNAISPGVIDTPMWKQVDSLFAQHENLKPGEKKKQVGDAVPLGYMGQPQDLIGIAIFLASSASDYITAQTINVDGGNVMS